MPRERMGAGRFQVRGWRVVRRRSIVGDFGGGGVAV